MSQLVKKLSEPLTTGWALDSKEKIETDLVGYLTDNIKVGFELELGWRGDRVEIEEEIDWEKEFGLTPPDLASNYFSRIGEYCVICSRTDCYDHMPPHLIHDVGSDGDGREFRVYCTSLSSECFIKFFPIEALRKYYRTGKNSGFHLHARIEHSKFPIPLIVINNVWQLYRCYYPAWAYMFGNYNNEKTGFMRSPSYGQHYFQYQDSLEHFKESGIGSKQFAIHFGRSRYGTGKWNNCLEGLDMEVRTPDSTLNLGQIVGARALTKALLIRAAEMSNYGFLSKLPKKNQDFINSHTMRERADSYSDYEIPLKHSKILCRDDLPYMKENAGDFFNEVYEYLTPFERPIVKRLIDSPVRDRADKNNDEFAIKVSEQADVVKRLIVVEKMKSDSPKEWIILASKILKMPRASILLSLKELNAEYNREVKRIVLA